MLYKVFIADARQRLFNRTGERTDHFNKPFMADSFIDFWSRWHITLSEWFRTYVFNLLVKRLAVIPGFHSALIAPIAFFLTFAVLGFWHGGTLIFIVYGLILGVGVSVNKAFQELLGKRLGKKQYRELKAALSYRSLCRGLTLAYFSFSLICFWYRPSIFGNVTSAVGSIGYVLTFVGLMMIFTFVSFLVEWPSRPFIFLRPLAMDANGYFYRSVLSGKIYLSIMTVVAIFNSTPEFVYKAF